MVQKVGKDLIIYIGKSELDRIKYGFKKLIQEEKGYRKIYIFHSPNSSEVAKGFKKEAKEYSVLEPELIEGEMWKKEHLKKNP